MVASMTAISLFVLALSGSLSALLLILIINAILTPSLKPISQRPSESPLVSVLIPARNEAARILPTLESVLNQDYENLELIVLDDHSSDKTVKAILEAFQSARIPTTLIHGAPLPDDWRGKNFACAQLAEFASGDLLLFIDADVVLEPFVLARTVQLMKSRSVGLLTCFPQQICRTFAEKCVVPLMDLFLYTCAPTPLIEKLACPSLAAANGQFMCFTKDCYRTIKGHTAVRDQIIEDVALARLTKHHRYPLILARGQGAVYCRMYDSWRAILDGFGKNIFAACRYRPTSMLVLLLLCAALLLSPHVIFVFDLYSQYFKHNPPAIGPLVPVALIVAIRTILSIQFKHPVITSIVLHPVTVILGMYVCLHSWLWHASGNSHWKGRAIVLPGRTNYRPDPVIVSIWLFLACGALFGRLSVFQPYNGTIASAALVAMSALAAHTLLKAQEGTIQTAGLIVTIMISSFIIEAIGVSTGFPFGNYSYTPSLQPQVFGTPVAISCAWLLVSICSAHIGRVSRFYLVNLFASGMLCLLFDVALEPAAAKLGLWHFVGDVPLANYLTWFFLGSLFGGLIQKVSRPPKSKLFLHLYTAQIFYFFLISQGS